MRKKRKTVWAFLDGKKLVDVVQAALDNNMMVDDLKAKLIAENPGHEVTFKECKRITAEINAELRTATSTLTDQYYARTISYSDYKKAFNKLKREASEQIDYQCRNAMGGGISSLEDIYDALSGGSARDAGLVRYGHGSKYYRDIGKRAEETLANYGALSVVRPDLIEMLRKDKPELVEALEEVIQDMLKKAGG